MQLHLSFSIFFWETKYLHLWVHHRLFLSPADSKPPIYNDKNAEENSGRTKLWVGKTLWVILHCGRLCFLFSFLHQITALHSVSSQLNPVSATLHSCKSSCCFYLLLTNGCHHVQPKKYKLLEVFVLDSMWYNHGTLSAKKCDPSSLYRIFLYREIISKEMMLVRAVDVNKYLKLLWIILNYFVW